MHGHNKSVKCVTISFPNCYSQSRAWKKARIPSAPFSFFTLFISFHHLPEFIITGPNLENTQSLYASRTPRHQAHGRPRRVGFHVSRCQRRHRGRKALRRQLSLRCSGAAWPATLSHSGEIVLQSGKTPLYRIPIIV